MCVCALVLVCALLCLWSCGVVHGRMTIHPLNHLCGSQNYNSLTVHRVDGPYQLTAEVIPNTLTLATTTAAVDMAWKGWKTGLEQDQDDTMTK